MKRFLLIALLLVSAGASAQTQPRAAAQAAPPPQPVAPVSVKTPPVPPDVQQRLPVPIAPPTVREIVESTVNDASDTVLDPGDVTKIRDKIMLSKQRQSMPTYPGNVLPKPVSRSVVIDPNPTEAPALVRLSASTITSFVFSDTNGNPWMIESKSFDTSMFSDGGSAPSVAASAKGGQAAVSSGGGVRQSNILNLQPLDAYAYGNIVVTLKGLPSPIVFMLAAGQASQVDVRVNVRVRAANPDARAEIVLSDAMPGHDPVMQDFLDGVPPSSAVPLKVAKGYQVWLFGGHMYLRSRNQVYAPAFENHVGAADGLHVYRFRRPEPLITVSNAGRPETVTISGY